MHPFFYNSKLGWLSKDNVSFGTLEIGDDAWIGANSMFTPSCTKVGVGAIVGAGSVVTKDVPDFAIVAGNPAHVLRRRFTDSICGAILASRWWERPIEEVAGFMNEMASPIGEDPSAHPLLAKPLSRI
jgi:carbonic anhydrase/acetyltransferase-like protein (isoleucine patch superfamily)